MVKLSFFPRFSSAKPASNNAESKKNVETTCIEKSPEKITEKSLNSEKSLNISATTGKSGLQISPDNKKSLQIIEIGKNISPNLKFNEEKSLQIIEIGKNISPKHLKSNEETPIRNSSITVLQKSVDGTLVEVGKSLPKINTSILGN